MKKVLRIIKKVCAGLVDDIAVLILAIKALVKYLTPEIKEKAREGVVVIFGNVSDQL